MRRYIDADVLSKAMRHLTLGETDVARATMKITHYICHMPSADVVEVVRCKDCKYMENHKVWFACTFWNADPYEQPSVNNYDFCSYGEKP